MRLYYTDHFELPLPKSHRFPMSKYRLLRHQVARDEAHENDALLVPPAASDDQILLCHDSKYLNRVKSGTLSDAEIRRIGFPWSEKMVERSRRSTGATIAAARAAIDDGIAANLAGGTHHAFADAGEGYCVFNDAAVAIRVLQKELLIDRAVVIDLDVHQGNGTASILAGDETAITFSMHGEKNFPLRKIASDIDVPLDDGTEDDVFLRKLDDGLRALGNLLDSIGIFQLAIYLAGADPLVSDRLGRMSMSKSGLGQRDEIVLSWCKNRGFPVAIAMAGGYSPKIQDIVDVHASTLRTASKFQQRNDNLSH